MDNRGFAAVVSAIERARDSLNTVSDRQIFVSRAIRDEAQNQTPIIERIYRSLSQKISILGNNSKAIPQQLSAKNLSSNGAIVEISAKSVAVTAASQASQINSTRIEENRLSLAIGKALKATVVRTAETVNPLKDIPLGILRNGVGGYLGNRFTGGFEKGMGLNTQSVGIGAGRIAGIPFDLSNQFKRGFFDEDGDSIFSDELKDDDRGPDGDSKRRSPKPNRPGGGGSTTGPNLFQRMAYQAGQSLGKFVDRDDATHASIDLWAEKSKEANLRFVVPQLIERVRQKFDKDSFKEKDILKAVEARKNVLKEAIAKEQSLPEQEQNKLKEQRKKQQVLSPQERLEFINFLEKHRKDLLLKYGKLLFRFRGQNKLKFEELLSIYYYTEAAGYREMNAVLRGQSRETAEALGIKEEHLKESGLRNINAATSGLNRLPSYRGKTYRGLELPTDVVDSYQVGKTIEEKGFTSTTKQQSMRYPGNVVWEINSRKGGKDISAVEAYTNEEVLFPPNSKFKVTGKRKVKKFGREFWVIQLDDLSDSKADLQPSVKFEQKRGGTQQSEPKNKLSDRYLVYLDKIREDAKVGATETIKAIAPNYSSLTTVGKQNFASDINKEFKGKAAQFRKAINDGNKLLAAELGEGLLKDAAVLREIYSDLKNDLKTDSIATRSMGGQISYISSVEREIVQGSQGKGRAPTGLISAIDESQSTGDDTALGFIEGIENKIKQIEQSGAEIGEAAIRGARERLGIQSPSTEFIEIGENSGEGYEIGATRAFQGASDAIEGILTDLGEATLEQVGNTAQAADRGIASFLGRARESFSSFFDSLLQRFPILREFANLILGLGASLLLGQILDNLVGWLTGVADASFGAVVEFESLTRAMESVTGSSEKAAAGLAYIRDEARRLGIDLKTAEEAYAGFKATTRFTPLQGEQGDRIFSIFAQTAALRGLTGEQQSRMFAALNQAFTKDKLSEEEITGQMGEIPALAFKQTLSRALGVGSPQLSKMIGSGQLRAQDVFPMVAAQYAAENASIANSSETTTQAMNRYNNAILNLQRAFKDWFAPAKIFFNAFAGGIELITNLIPGLVKVLSILTAQLLLDSLWGFVNWFVNLKTVAALATNALKSLASFLNAFRAEILSFLRTFILMTLAFDALGAAINVTQNAFPELQKSISETTTRAKALEAALLGVANASKNIKPVRTDLPTNRDDISTDKKWNVLGIQTPFSLEPIRKFLGTTTLGNKELGDFQVGLGDLVSGIDRTLSKQFETEKILEDLKEIDKQLTIIRSRRFNIPAGDKQNYQKSIDAEQKLLEKRDLLLKATSQFQANLENDRQSVKQQLEELDKLAARKGITQQAEASMRFVLENRLADIDKTKSAFEDLVASLAKSINALELALRNMNEQAAYFNETLERTATTERTGTINQGLATGQGSQSIDLGLQSVDRSVLSARLVFLRDQFAAINELLARPDFDEIVSELKSQAEDWGLNLENTATLDRLIGEGRSQQETAVLNALKRQLELKDQVAQTDEQLAQANRTAVNSLFDLNKGIKDYFFNLEQQIKETLNEIDKLISQLKYGDIKGKLQRALVPGSDSFINGIISQIQGIFDQASQISEQILGQKGARIGFEGEKKGLQDSLIDFTRNLGGATEAIIKFRDSLLGTPQSSQPTSQPNRIAVPQTIDKNNPYGPLLRLISSGEGGVSSANRGKAGDTPGGLKAILGKNAEQLTVGQILAAQKQGRLFAVGAYQFIPGTLRQAVAASGIALTELFNKQTQDILAISLLYNKRPQIGKFLTGKNNNLTEAAQDMAREWASIGLTYAEAGRRAGSSRYAGLAGNAASITPQQVQLALQQTRQNLQQGSVKNVSYVERTSAPIKSANLDSNEAQKAKQDTDTLIKLKEGQLNLGDAGVRQAIDNFKQQLSSEREAIKRQSADNIRNTQNTVIDTKNQFLDLKNQYSPQTQTSQRESELRGVQSQYRNFDNQLFEQERTLGDSIKGLEKLITEAEPIIKILKTSNNELDRESAKFLEGLVGGFKSDKQAYEGMLSEIKDVRSQLAAGKVDAEKFVELQAKMRLLGADLERIGIELSVAQHNLEQERTIALKQSEKQLESDILKISQDFADNPTEAKERIELAKQQAKIREQEINYQYESKRLSIEQDKITQELTLAQEENNLARIKDLGLLQSQKQLEQEILEIKKQFPALAEQELRIELAKKQAVQREQNIDFNYRRGELARESQFLDFDSQIKDAKANQLDRFGDRFGANRIRRDSAIAQENLRYLQEILELEASYQDQPELLEKLKTKAAELNQIRLDEIRSQFKSLKDELVEIGANALTGFFEDILSGTVSVGEAFTNMAKSVIRSLTQIAAQMLAMQAIKAISGVFGFKFSSGGPVGRFAGGGFVEEEAIEKSGGGPINGPGTATSDSIPAWLSNGEYVIKADAVRHWGVSFFDRLNQKQLPEDKPNPIRKAIAKIGEAVYAATGGLITDGTAPNWLPSGGIDAWNQNLLADLSPRSATQLSLSGNLKGSGGATSNRSTTVNQTINVTSPDANSFRKTELQLGRDSAEMARRAFLRNG